MENFSTKELLAELLNRKAETTKGLQSTIANELAMISKKNAIFGAMSTEKYMTAGEIATLSGVNATSVQVIISKSDKVEKKTMADAEKGKLYTVYKLIG